MTIGWHFDNTYSKLSNIFKEDIKPTAVHSPELVILNKELAKDLNLDFSKIDNSGSQTGVGLISSLKVLDNFE